MPFETRPLIQHVKVPDLDTVDDNVIVIHDDDNGAEALSVVDDNDVMLLVKDKPATTDDILFLRDNTDGTILVQDRAATSPVEPAYLTESQETVLIDAGPVFRGPAGQNGLNGLNGLNGQNGSKGDPGAPGLDLFHTWKLQPGNENGSFNDFMDVLRQGLGAGQSGQGTFVFVQNLPSAMWIIIHNLNRYPIVTFEDSAGEPFDADYTYLNPNVIEVDIISPMAGKAYLN